MRQLFCSSTMNDPRNALVGAELRESHSPAKNTPLMLAFGFGLVLVRRLRRGKWPGSEQLFLRLCVAQILSQAYTQRRWFHGIFQTVKAVLVDMLSTCPIRARQHQARPQALRTHAENEDGHARRKRQSQCACCVSDAHLIVCSSSATPKRGVRTRQRTRPRLAP